MLSKGKFFPYSFPSAGPGADLGVQAVSPQVTLSHPPGDKLLLLSARPAVTFPAKERYRQSVGTKLYCSVTEAYACEQLARGKVTWKRTGRDSNPQLFGSRANVTPHKPLHRVSMQNTITAMRIGLKCEGHVDICVPPTATYLQYRVIGLTPMAVGLSQSLAQRSGTVSRISSGTRQSALTLSDVC